MHPKSWSVFFLRPRCTSATFYSKSARYSVHLSESSMMDILKRSIFFTEVKKKVVLACLRLETGSNVYYFWSFTMHSISSLNFFSRPWCNSTLFYSKKKLYLLFISAIQPWGTFWKEAIFSQMTQKSGFSLSTLRNRFQQLLLLKFHHALNIFIKLLFAALVHFHSVLI